MGEGWYADIQEQAQEDATKEQRCLAALRVWDKAEDLGKEFTLFTKLYRALEKTSLIFFVFCFAKIGCSSEQCHIGP